MRIEITNLPESDDRDVRLLLRDALTEFIWARRGDYVERRYPDQPEWVKKDKRVSVAKRLALAAELRQLI